MNVALVNLLEKETPPGLRQLTCVEDWTFLHVGDGGFHGVDGAASALQRAPPRGGGAPNPGLIAAARGSTHSNGDHETSSETHRVICSVRLVQVSTVQGWQGVH